MCEKIKTRVCRKEDINRVLEIENLCFEYPYPKHVFEGYLGSELFLIAEIDDEIVGYIIGDAREDEGVVISIAVDPCFQRKGIGKLLMKEITKGFSTDYIVLTVRTSNKDAQRFYEHLGFERFYMITDYYSNDEDALVMGKKLSENE